MPTPLFPFVWSYNNQTIEVLANDIAGLMVNTDTFIPVSNGSTFIDSTIIDTGDTLITRHNNFDTGINMNYTARKFVFGAQQIGNRSNVNINDSSSKVSLESTNGIGSVDAFGVDAVNDTLFSQGVTAVTAGAPIAKFLKIVVDGLPQRIQLLDV